MAECGQNEFRLYDEIKAKLDIVTFHLVSEGLSPDKKFYIETSDGRKYLLRVSERSEYERKRTVYDIMKKADEIGVPMCRPVDFGICGDGKNVYQLMTWCEGINLEQRLPSMPDSEQYAVGIKAGNILRTIHSVPAPPEMECWQKRYFSQNDVRVKSFLNCGIQIEGSDILYQYMENHKHLLINRPQCLQHGDYHTGNLMITGNGDLSVIDWELLDFDNYADPWNEFTSIGLSKMRPCFNTGMIQGYFGGEPPEGFWELLAFYLAAGALMLVSWAYYVQQDELAYATQHVKDVLYWYDGFHTVVPGWYGKQGSSLKQYMV